MSTHLIERDSLL